MCFLFFEIFFSFVSSPTSALGNLGLATDDVRVMDATSSSKSNLPALLFNDFLRIISKRNSIYHRDRESQEEK